MQARTDHAVMIARMGASRDARPANYAESLDVILELPAQLVRLADAFDRANTPMAKYKERLVGMLLGVVASLVAATLWWLATGKWAVLKT